MPPSVFWPLGYSRACDHERMMLDNTVHGLPLAPMLGSQRLLGRVEILVILQYNSNNLGREGIGASCIPKMQSYFCQAFYWGESYTSKYSLWSTWLKKFRILLLCHTTCVGLLLQQSVGSS